MKNIIMSEQLNTKLNELLQKPNANTNTVFMDTMHLINSKAQKLGYTNGIAWIRDAVDAGELTANDLTEFETCHPLRNLISHGGASEITVSDSRCVFVLGILSKIEQTKVSADGVIVEEAPAEKATPEEIEEWYQIAKAHYERKEFESAVTYYHKAAAQGEARSQNNLGVCYDNGEGVPKDMSRAVYWFKKAAEQGNAIAQDNLAGIYQYGRGVDKDWAMAVSLYEKAAKQDYAVSQFKLAICYQFGKGVKKNDKEAVKWYEKAAKQDYAPAMCGLGYCYYNGIGVRKNYEKALLWYEKGAKQGNAGSIRGLGDYYYDGYGTPRDYDKAAQYYRSAADKNDPLAQVKLGFCYYEGEGVGKNCDMASEYFLYAAKKFDAELRNGSPEEHYVCAKALEKHRFTLKKVSNRDYVEEWFKKAADQHHDKTLIVYGKRCMSQIPHTEANCVQARRWFRIAADEGSGEAMYYMGYSYTYCCSQNKENMIEAGRWHFKAALAGFGPVKETVYGRGDDNIESNTYYIDLFIKTSLTQELVDEMRRASERGVYQASVLLSTCYESGYYVEKNSEEGYRYLTLAAKQGDAESQRRLALVDSPNRRGAEKRSGEEIKAQRVSEEKEKAKLLTEAAESGDGIAQYHLGRAYAHGSGVQKNEKKAFEWYLKSTEQRKHEQTANAYYEVMRRYENGIGVEKDTEKAKSYYFIALGANMSQEERAELNYKCGMYYCNGDTRTPYSAGKSYLIKAAELGHQEAKQMLGYVKFRSFLEIFKKK